MSERSWLVTMRRQSTSSKTRTCSSRSSTKIYNWWMLVAMSNSGVIMITCKLSYLSSEHFLTKKKHYGKEDTNSSRAKEIRRKEILKICKRSSSNPLSFNRKCTSTTNQAQRWVINKCSSKWNLNTVKGQKIYKREVLRSDRSTRSKSSLLKGKRRI